MTGICGLVDWSGDLDIHAEVLRMKEALARFPHAGAVQKTFSGASLAMVYGNAQSIRSPKPQPYSHEGWYSFTEARLDEPLAVAQSLGCDPHHGHAELLTQGLFSIPQSKWRMLSGDWLSVAWNPNSRCLQIVREPYGMNFLYYVQGKNFFAFSTTIDALQALACLELPIRHSVLARSMINWSSPLCETLYESVEFLPPATRLLVTDTDLKLNRYWAMEEHIDVQDVPFEEASEEMHRLMRQSAARRADPRLSIGSMLSSGLDSSSVSALACQELALSNHSLDVYCSAPKFKEKQHATPMRFGDESPLAQSFADSIPNMRFHSIEASDITPIEGLERTVDAVRLPRYATSNDYWMHALMDKAHLHGNDVMLNGGLGNFTYSWGYWPALTIWDALRAGEYRRALGKLRSGKFAMNVRRKLENRRMKGEPWKQYSPIASGFAREQGLHAAIESGEFNAAFYQQQNLSSVAMRLNAISPQLGVGLLWTMHGRTQSIDVLDVTADLDLIQFCLNLSDRSFMGPNWTSRGLAMHMSRSLLPDNIRTNPKRGYQGSDLIARMVEDQDRLESLLDTFRRNPEINHVLDMKLMDRAWQEVRTGNSYQAHIKCYSTLFNGLVYGLFLLSHLRQ